MPNHRFIGINLCHYRINFILHACDYALFHWLDVKVKARLCFCQLRMLSVCCVRWIFTHKYWFKAVVLRNFEAAHVSFHFISTVTNNRLHTAFSKSFIVKYENAKLNEMSSVMQYKPILMVFCVVFTSRHVCMRYYFIIFELFGVHFSGVSYFNLNMSVCCQQTLLRFGCKVLTLSLSLTLFLSLLILSNSYSGFTPQTRSLFILTMFGPFLDGN